MAFEVNLVTRGVQVLKTVNGLAVLLLWHDQRNWPQ